MVNFFLEWIYFLGSFKFGVIIFLFLVLSDFLFVLVKHLVGSFLGLDLVLFRRFFFQWVFELVEQWQLILLRIIDFIFV